jgi:hypothetical protein
VSKSALLANRHAAHLVVFEDTARIADFEGGDLLAIFEGDHDGLVGGMGRDRGEQDGDQEALEGFSGCHFGVSALRFVLMPKYAEDQFGSLIDYRAGCAKFTSDTKEPASKADRILDREGKRQCAGLGPRLLRAADLTFFQHTTEITNLEGGDLFAIF